MTFDYHSFLRERGEGYIDEFLAQSSSTYGVNQFSRVEVDLLKYLNSDDRSFFPDTCSVRLSGYLENYYGVVDWLKAHNFDPAEFMNARVLPDSDLSKNLNFSAWASDPDSDLSNYVNVDMVERVIVASLVPDVMSEMKDYWTDACELVLLSISFGSKFHASSAGIYSMDTCLYEYGDEPACVFSDDGDGFVSVKVYNIPYYRARELSYVYHWIFDHNNDEWLPFKVSRYSVVDGGTTLNMSFSTKH